MQFLLKTDSIKNEGDSNCNHPWIFNHVAENTGDATYPYHCLRVCSKCNRLEEVSMNYLSSKTKDYENYIKNIPQITP